MRLNDSLCHYCDKRYPGCSDHCPERQAEIIVKTALKDKAKRKKELDIESWLMAKRAAKKACHETR